MHVRTSWCHNGYGSFAQGGPALSVEKPIEPSTVMQFQTEKLRRTIQECQDIKTLRGIAMELLQLHEKKSAIAE